VPQTPLGRPPSAALEAFGLEITASATPMGGVSANRTWRVRAEAGGFFLKEFRYPPADHAWVASLRSAVAFEVAVWASGVIDVPTPVAGRSGDFLQWITGSQGEEALVRLHQWTPGRAEAQPASPEMIRAAGAQLGKVQAIGATHASATSGTLLWWNWVPQETLARLGVAGLLSPAEVGRWRPVLEEAVDLAQRGQQSATWSFGHGDHKPDNVLAVGDRLILTDWDEASLCPPRYEAVEAALLWSGWNGRQADRSRMAAYLDGYRSAGGALDRLERLDFSKWAAQRVGWFEYLARRTLGSIRGSTTEVQEARIGAIETLHEIRAGLEQVDRWMSWFA
jgi:Ser/Thr protein kinase RdoA (MazF antagonist)